MGSSKFNDRIQTDPRSSIVKVIEIEGIHTGNKEGSCGMLINK